MSLTTALQALDAQRDALANNLTTKGVAAANTETLAQLVPKVLEIPSGTSFFNALPYDTTDNTEVLPNVLTDTGFPTTG